MPIALDPMPTLLQSANFLPTETTSKTLMGQSQRHMHMRQLACICAATFVLWACQIAPAAAAHAYAQFGDIKYPSGFSHFSYVNPDAPKGGEIRMVPPTRPTNFDKFNPFTLKGTAPHGVGGLLLETLLTGNAEEPTTAYGLLAEDVFSRDSVREQASSMGRLESVGSSWRLLDEWPQALRAITPEAVQQAAVRWLVPPRRTVLRLEPVAMTTEVQP